LHHAWPLSTKGVLSSTATTEQALKPMVKM
jgi:hypothetical protein